MLQRIIDKKIKIIRKMIGEPKLDKQQTQHDVVLGFEFV